MTEVAGNLPFFEGAKVSAILGRNVLGWLRYAWAAAYVAAVAAGGAVGVWLASRADDMSGGTAAALAVAVVAILIGVLMVVSRLIRRAIRRRWHARGVPEIGHAKIAITPEALRIEAMTATTTIPWRYVSELIVDRRYLLFVVAGLCYFVPRRFFATSAEETAFIEEARARLTPEALARSATGRG